jgi:hypothetical protein
MFVTHSLGVTRYGTKRFCYPGETNEMKGHLNDNERTNKVNRLHFYCVFKDCYLAITKEIQKTNEHLKNIIFVCIKVKRSKISVI